MDHVLFYLLLSLSKHAKNANNSKNKKSRNPPLIVFPVAQYSVEELIIGNMPIGLITARGKYML